MIIDIPSKDILPQLEEGVKEMLDKLPIKIVDIEKIEWTKEGLRVWTQKKK